MGKIPRRKEGVIKGLVGAGGEISRRGSRMKWRKFPQGGIVAGISEGWLEGGIRVDRRRNYRRAKLGGGGQRRLRTTPTTPNDFDSGRLRTAPDDSERLRILQRGPTFRSRFRIYRSWIGVDSGFLPTLPITTLNGFIPVSYWIPIAVYSSGEILFASKNFIMPFSVVKNHESLKFDSRTKSAVTCIPALLPFNRGYV